MIRTQYAILLDQRKKAKNRLAAYILFLVIATLYSLIFAIMVYVFYSDYCNPVMITANLGSTFSFIDEILSY